MPLVTYADTQAPYAGTYSEFQGQPIWQVMRQDVASRKMPQGDFSLDDSELAILNAWFDSGAPATTQPCGDSGAPDSSGPSSLPCSVTRTFTAHADGDVTAPYPVPSGTDNRYACFNFSSPFALGEQMTAIAPIVGDARVIHHWILYGNTAFPPPPDGSVTTGCGFGTFIAGWAPGGRNTVLPDDVGVKLDYASFSLQVHYNNYAGPDTSDASGAAFCTTQKPRQHEAGVVTLGRELFSIPSGVRQYPVTGTCNRLASDGFSTITVISTAPHMHLLGSGFRTEQLRNGASVGDLSYIPMGAWNFDNQKYLPVEPRRQILPGDVLKTTCYYDNAGPPVVFGDRTEDEMCFDFLTVYPYAAANRDCAQLF